MKPSHYMRLAACISLAFTQACVTVQRGIGSAQLSSEGKSVTTALTDTQKIGVDTSLFGGFVGAGFGYNATKHIIQTKQDEIKINSGGSYLRLRAGIPFGSQDQHSFYSGYEYGRAVLSHTSFDEELDVFVDITSRSTAHDGFLGYSYSIRQKDFNVFTESIYCGIGYPICVLLFGAIVAIPGDTSVLRIQLEAHTQRRILAEDIAIDSRTFDGSDDRHLTIGLGFDWL